MKNKRYVGILCALLVFLAAGGLLVRAQAGQKYYLPLVFKPAALQCRFGVATVATREGVAIPGYADAGHLQQLKSGGLIDWGITPGKTLNGEITYVHVLRTGKNYNAGILSQIPTLVKTYPGAYWQVGNEPDTCYEEQDCATPEVYAQNYYAIATALRTNDPYAKIAFGSIVQPTPVRLFYLQRAWDRLAVLAGSVQNARALVDFWSIHAFILNEVEGQWGTGMPKFEPGTQNIPAPVVITNFADTYNISIFQNRVSAMRNWMNSNGERNKALWITEYGSLFPPIDPPGGPNLENVPDAATAAYMTASFDYLLNTTSASTGMPGDGNRLVQRWFWYSLNDHRYTFGGTLFDPANGAITPVGQAYAAYTAPLKPDGSCKP